MSPEQARGAAVDERTDIWAFGCVLYELLSGRRTFVGDSAVQILNAVIEREPDWTAISHVPPPSRSWFAAVCRKIRGAGCATSAMRVSSWRTPRRSATRPTQVARAAGRPWLWMSAGLSAGLLARPPPHHSRTGDGSRPRPSRRNVRVENVTDAVGLEESPAISPDGKMVAFTAFSGGRRQFCSCAGRRGRVASGDE